MKSSKPTSKQYKKKADDLARAMVRSRGVCELRGKDRVKCNGVLQWAHIVGRGNHRLRWETWNALCLCAGHHVYYTNHPDKWFWDIIPKHFPEQHVLIQKHRHEPFQKNYVEIIENLEKSSTKSID